MKETRIICDICGHEIKESDGEYMHGSIVPISQEDGNVWIKEAQRWDYDIHFKCLEKLRDKM